MKHMAEIGIRALKQNASAAVARAASGEVLTVTDRGHPVAQLVPLPERTLDGLVDAGLARSPKRSLSELPMPAGGAPLSDALREQRDAERY
jgi:prevent-host-death family protein